MAHRAAAIVLVVGVIIYILLFSALSIARYEAFNAAILDLGIMTQVTWNTAHGRPFETSIDRATETGLIGSYLGNHVRPILLLIAPVYRLWPDPRLLLILQSLALGVAAIPLYGITCRQTDDGKAGLIVAACYLAYPALGFLNLFDFHPVALSIPLLFVAYWALEEKRMPLFWIAVVLALWTKEELVVPLSMWGLVNLLEEEKRGVGLGLLGLAVMWALLSFGVIIPHFNEGEAYRFWELWSHLPLFSFAADQGGGALVIGSGSASTVALFLIHLFLPLGFLPFLRYRTLAVALPSLAYLLLGKSPAFHAVGYQYPAVLIPWFFLAVVEGLKRLGGGTPGARRAPLYRLGLAFLVVGTIGINMVLNPVFLYVRKGIHEPDPHQQQIEEAMAQIPPEAGVATIGRFGPQLANRRVLVPLTFPPPFRLDHVRMADMVLFELPDRNGVTEAGQNTRYGDIIMEVLKTGEYGVRYREESIVLLERGATAEEEEMAALREYVGNVMGGE